MVYVSLKFRLLALYGPQFSHVLLEPVHGTFVNEFKVTVNLEALQPGE